jgi:hypothetical protein
MTALAKMARTWPMLAAFGAGLVLLAVAAGAGGPAGGVLAGVGVAALAWGVLSLHLGRPLAPAAALAVGVALLVGAALLVGSGLSGAAGVPAGPLLAASVFAAVVAGHAGFILRRRARTATPARAKGAPDAAGRAVVDGRLSLVGLVAGALLVAGLATPAIAATEAGRLAVPHGEHSGWGSSSTTAPGHHH